MSKLIFKVGDIIVNEVRQYAKVISEKNSIYGLSAWTTQGNAEKANVSEKFLNIYGMQNSNFKVVKSGAKARAKAPAKASARK